MEPADKIENCRDEAQETLLAERCVNQTLSGHRLPELVADQVIEQCVLVDEVRIERGAIHGRSGRDVLHAYCMKALLGEELGEGVQEQPPGARNAWIFVTHVMASFPGNKRRMLPRQR